MGTEGRIEGSCKGESEGEWERSEIGEGRGKRSLRTILSMYITQNAS